MSQKKDRLYLKGTVTGTMVDLGEITYRDPDPRTVEDTSADVL